MKPMEAAEFETDELLKLLTDAIRRGPGSPEWHDAVQRLRNSGAQSSDEYRLLMDVRDRLESGKSYREVRAGPEFTRAVFSKLDQPANGKKPIVTFIVSFVSLLILVGSVAMLLKMMSGTRDDQSLVRLSNQLFTTIRNNWTFNTGMLPEDLKASGDLKYSNGVKIDLDPSRTEPATSKITFDQSLDLETGICIEAVVLYKPGENNQMNLLLTKTKSDLGVNLSQSGFNISRGETSVTSKSLPGGEYTVRIKAQRQNAVVEVNGQSIWSGEIAMENQAHLSVLFQRSGKTDGDIRLMSLKILTP